MYEEWWDCKGEIQSLPRIYVPKCPYKAGMKSPLRNLPGGENPGNARVDPAHTWAIAGIGKDLCASSILFSAEAGLFGKASMTMKRRLDHAFESFQQYLLRSQKYSSIDHFSDKTLKCGKKILNLELMQSF